MLYAYPAAMTPGCTTQACDFRDSLDASARRRASPSSASRRTSLSSSPSSASATRLTFPLVGDPTKETLTAYGAYGEKNLYGKTVIGVIRSTFVIDADGKIERAMYAVKAKGHVAKLRQELGL